MPPAMPSSGIKEVLRDIGTLPGDYVSAGLSINNSGEIVGESCDINDNCRFFVWAHGTMIDLGTLLPAELATVNSVNIDDQ